MQHRLCPTNFLESPVDRMFAGWRVAQQTQYTIIVVGRVYHYGTSERRFQLSRRRIQSADGKLQTMLDGKLPLYLVYTYVLFNDKLLLRRLLR